MFLKEILYYKRKLDDNETVEMTVDNSAAIQNKLPHMLKDLWSFPIPCEIGIMSFKRALNDLGANVI